MKAKLTRNYQCSPDGVTLVAKEGGDIVTGQFAIYAIQDGAAIEMRDPAPDIAKSPTPEIIKLGKRGK